LREKIYNYQKSNRYFAQCANDIKEIAQDELVSLGAQEISSSYRGFYFNASPYDLYKINYRSSLINRVLAPLIRFNVHSDKYLYQTAKQIRWEHFLTPEKTFAVFAALSQSKIQHSKFAALRLKDAIADYFKEKFGKRPSVEKHNPDVWFNLFIENNYATISLDTSGGSLHRRGYRRETTQAPLSETLAASILTHSGWNGQTRLYDPFCGSGTILCEAWFKATNTPISFMRKNFGFMHLPDYDSKLWNKVKKAENSKIVHIENGLISGSDIQKDVVEIAKINSAVVDKYNKINIKEKDMFSIKHLKDTTIVCNPPYGLRLEKGKDLSSFYKNLGDFLKQNCQGSTAYIYFGERKYIKNIGLRASQKIPLKNAKLDGRLVKYELY
jgi:putative N6-adenine-specific DNA methylase